MKVIGYILAVVGLVVVVLGSGFFGDFNYFNFNSLYISVGGVVLIVVGALLSAKGSGGRKKGSGGEDEIPIYEGVGKKRRIVGYRKG